MKTYTRSVIRLVQTWLIMTVAVLASHKLHGQGTVNFSNVGLISPVGILCAPNGFMPAPAGTAFSVALYFAPHSPGISTPPDPSTFTQVGASAFLVAPGIYDAGIRTAPITPPGGMGWFQVKAWATAYGSTYEQAQANGANLLGVSGMIDIPTGNPGPPTTTPARLTGMGAIVLNLDPIPCVPEPSAFLLVFIGAATVCFFSLKNRND
jgi:hypothetical protein